MNTGTAIFVILSQIVFTIFILLFQQIYFLKKDIKIQRDFNEKTLDRIRELETKIYKIGK